MLIMMMRMKDRHPIKVIFITTKTFAHSKAVVKTLYISTYVTVSLDSYGRDEGAGDT